MNQTEELIYRLREEANMVRGLTAFTGVYQALNDASDALLAAQAASVPAAELEALRKDAERYRRLRRMDWFDGPLCVVRDPQIKGRVGLGSDCPSGTRLDDAIDAAIAGEKP